MFTKRVNVKDRIVNDECGLYLGVQSDHQVTRCEFVGIDPGFTPSLVELRWALEDKTASDIVILNQGDKYIWEITNKITQYGGKTIFAYIRATAGSIETNFFEWGTEPFPVEITKRPNVDAATAIFTPTVIDQTIAAIAANRIAMENAQHAAEEARDKADADARATGEDRLAVAQDKLTIEGYRADTLGAKQAADEDAQATALDRQAVSQDRTAVETMKGEVQTLKNATDTNAQSTSNDRQAVAADKGIVGGYKDTTLTAKQAAEAAAQATLEDRQAVAEDKATTHTAMQTAVEKALVAYQSMIDAGVSRDQAAQALADLLAMLGSQVATLGPDGKLTPGQIPPISINDVFPVPDTAAMLALTAERGDTALIVAGGVVVDSYILMTDDPTQISNWAKLGVSYVANAGHAATADAATDAMTINGKRMIGMTQTQYEIARTSGTLDDETYYIVTPDA